MRAENYPQHEQFTYHNDYEGTAHHITKHTNTEAGQDETWITAGSHTVVQMLLTTMMHANNGKAANLILYPLNWLLPNLFKWLISGDISLSKMLSQSALTALSWVCARNVFILYVLTTAKCHCQILVQNTPQDAVLCKKNLIICSEKPPIDDHFDWAWKIFNQKCLNSGAFQPKMLNTGNAHL